MKPTNASILVPTVIEKTVGGEPKSYRFVRADRFSSKEDVVSFALAKGRQIIDEQGETIFAQSSAQTG